MILVISNKDDAHADFIIQKFNDRGLAESIVRINTEDFAINSDVTFENDKCQVTLRDSKREIDSSKVSKVWYRKTKSVSFNHADNGIQEYVVNAYNNFLKGFYYLTSQDATWINRPDVLEKTKYKLQQLYYARFCGFRIPNTIVSNNYYNVKKFLEHNPQCCIKSLSMPYFNVDNKLYPFYTKVVDPQLLLADKQALEVCPMIIQEFIDKKLDIRVVVFGSKVFAFEIHSQKEKLSQVDFRGISPSLLEHRVHFLPKALEISIIKFVNSQGLFFSALDFVLDQNDNYVFLENNPNGQWLWLEFITDVKMSEHFIECLLDTIKKN